MQFLPKLLMAAVIVVISGLLAFSFINAPKNPTTVKHIEDQVRKGVPLGSTREEVESWLKYQGVEYGYYDEPHVDRANGAELDPGDHSGVVHAIIRDTDRGFPIQGNICLTFSLDKNGKTFKHAVEWVGTGP